MYKLHEVTTVRCKECKEILVKVYPWAFIDTSMTSINVVCGKCSNKRIKKTEKKVTYKTPKSIKKYLKKKKAP